LINAPQDVFILKKLKNLRLFVPGSELFQQLVKERFVTPPELLSMPGTP